MPRNGSGTYTLPQAAFISGTTISSSAMNSDLSDIATALTQSLSSDGQTAITGAIKFSSGTAAAPGITFASDSTTGIYLPSASNLGLAAGGTSVVTSSASATTWNLNTTVSGTLTSTGTLAATNNATVGGTLAVTGNSTFTGTVSDPRGQYTGVKLNSLTASNSASLSDTTSLTSSYSTYLITFTNVLPATAGTILKILVSTNGGSSYLSTGYVSAAGAITATSGIIVASSTNGVINSAGYGVNGHCHLFNPLGGAGRAMFSGISAYKNNAGSPTFETVTFGGYQDANTAINAIQFLMGTGNITSGTINIYGIV